MKHKCIYLFCLISFLLIPNTFTWSCGLACSNWERTSFAERPDYREDIPYRDCFQRSSATYGVPESLLVSVASGESDFNSHAISASEALGLMQIKWPITAKHLGVKARDSLFRPCYNISLGAKYLRELLGRYDNSIHHALGAYYYGPSRVMLGEVMPSPARRYSMYIFNRYNRLVSKQERQSLVAQVAPKIVHYQVSKEEWIRDLNSEKNRLTILKQDLVRSSKRIKTYFKTEHQAHEKS